MHLSAWWYILLNVESKIFWEQKVQQAQNITRAFFCVLSVLLRFLASRICFESFWTGALWPSVPDALSWCCFLALVATQGVTISSKFNVLAGSSSPWEENRNPLTLFSKQMHVALVKRWVTAIVTSSNSHLIASALYSNILSASSTCMISTTETP